MGRLKIHFLGNDECSKQTKNITTEIEKVTCKKCLKSIESSLEIAKNKVNKNRVQNKKKGTTYNVKPRATPEELAKKYIKSLPDLYFLRELARKKHRESKSKYNRNKLEDRERKNYERWGFTDEALKEILQKQRRILKDKIKLKKKCNCVLEKGDTEVTLMNGERHSTTCDRGIEYIKKYEEILEKYGGK